MDQDSINLFRDKLDQHYQWPTLYTFKFIVPKGKEQLVKDLLPNHSVSEKASREGNYTSLTFQIMAQSSQVIIDIYQKASAIAGLIAL
ncbi:MAG: DUF493 domain-containing protein [Cyclobacteriaceae bacterium]|nr:DUF493 domain-containing protein [Cyclobacteriaceae bacterium]